MPKVGGSKAKLSVTISQDVLNQFNEYCEEKSINKSKFVEKRIKNFFEGKEK